MTAVRRAAYATFGVACLHLVFGAIVRITGSGMGCGPHWPRCYGYWFPPMSRPDLVIEVTHRYLASVLLLSLIALVVTALRHRREPGVGGRHGVLRPAVTALALGFGAALLGAVTVKFQNAPLATLAHWTVAMSLVAAVAATVVRAGGLGGASARLGGASDRARRATAGAAALALLAVVMGGLTAKTPGAPVACQSFLPFCNPNPDVVAGAVHVQVTHRWIAVLLVLHLVGLFFAFRKRREPRVVRRAQAIALGLGVLQLLVAGAMIGMRLPPVLRSLHEATGVSIWIACFVLALLTRMASRPSGGGEVATLLPDAPLPGSGSVRVEPAAGIAAAISSGPVTAAPAVAGASPSAMTSASGERIDASWVFETPDEALECGVAASLAIASLAAVRTAAVSRTEIEVSRPVAVEVSDVDYADVVDVELMEIIDGIAVGAGSGQETWAAEYWAADVRGVEPPSDEAPPEASEASAIDARAESVAAGVAIASTAESSVAIKADEDKADVVVATVVTAHAVDEAGLVSAAAVSAAVDVGDSADADGGVDVAVDGDADVDDGIAMDGGVDAEGGMDAAVGGGADGGLDVGGGAAGDPAGDSAVDVAVAVGVVGDGAVAEVGTGETVVAEAAVPVGADRAELAVGAPPTSQDTSANSTSSHPTTAPRTIFDAPTNPDPDADLLAALGPDPFDDVDDVDDTADDAVLTLDEEFSLDALDAVETRDEIAAAAAAPAAVALPPAVVVPPGAVTYHSVFVIVARGAGF